MKGCLSCRFLVITAFIVVISCDQIPTKKIPSSQYLEEEWKAIDLSQVEEYPTFETCKTIVDREELKNCFEQTVTKTFYKAFEEHTIIVNRELDEIIYVDFVVNEKGNYCIDSLKITQEIRMEIPQLEKWIHEAAKQLPIASKPAYKHGVPVKTRFKIPVILKVD